MHDQPKYRRLIEDFEARILSGQLQPGHRFTSEPALAEELGVSYMTLRKAFDELALLGYLYRVRGRGTYVADRPPSDQRPSLGLLLIKNWHSIDPFYFPPMVTGFVERAELLGFQVHLADRSGPLMETLVLQKHHIRAVACVLLSEEDIADTEALLDQGVMVVSINRYDGARRIPSISPNNRAAMKEAASELIRLGHRKFAFLAGPKWNFDANERRLGLEQAMDDAGRRIGLTIWDGGFEETDGYAVGQRMLVGGSLPTAVLAVGDLAAIGFMKAMAEAEVKVPEQMSVFGFGDFRLSGYVHPALSTARLPLEEIGARTAEALGAMYRGLRVESFSVPCPLCWRESTGPAPKRNVQKIRKKT